MPTSPHNFSIGHPKPFGKEYSQPEPGCEKPKSVKTATEGFSVPFSQAKSEIF